MSQPHRSGAALAYIEAIAPGRPMFVEEVLPPGEIRALMAVATKTSVPIACGERLADRIEFNELFRTRAIDIAQPDICHCGGLLETKKIAAMAEAASIGVAPHNPLGPIAGVAALQREGYREPKRVVMGQISESPGACPIGLSRLEAEGIEDQENRTGYSIGEPSASSIIASCPM